MRDAVQEPDNTTLREEIFRLNLSYLLLARRLIAEDEHQAQILLGTTEPLTSWLRDASTQAITALASAPVTILVLRLPRKAASRLLAACNDAQWLGPVHVAVSALGVSHGHSR